MEYIEEEYIYAIAQKDKFFEIILQSLNEVKVDVRQIIKKRWLSGESAKGGKIVNKNTGGGYSSLMYKNMKLLKNPSAGGNIDLTLTGALGDNIEIVITQSGDGEIISTDSKYNIIGNTYGFDEIGLSDSENQLVMMTLGNLISEKINNLN